MSASVAVKVFIIVLVLSLFSCGELETLLPSNGSYQVKTLVNGASLEDCSIIRSNDKIRPYFAVSVEDDPDLVGLLMYLQNSQGEIVGEKIRYILEAYADESAQDKTETQEQQEETEFREPDNEAPDELSEPIENIEKTEETTDKTIDNKTIDKDKTEGNETKGLTTLETPEVKEKRSSANTNKIREKSAAIEIVVNSLTEELPYFPLPKNTEPSSYTLVFEALGKKEVLSRTETNVFYLGSAEFNLKDVSVYLPGLSGLQLISPETTVMLETRLDFDSRLEPYVIWYNGKNIISEGKFSDGAGNILWKAPPQAGFYSLRLEVLPLRLKRSFAGISREITLPVSPKAVSLGYFFENNPDYTARSPLAEGTAYPEQVRLIAAMSVTEDTKGDEETEPATPVPPAPPELLRWYQFDGSLNDTMSPLVEEQSFASAGKKLPRWAAAGQSYGLSTEANDAYQLSSINFFLKEQDQGGGIFLLHIKPSVTGLIFSAFFPVLASEKDGVWMDMIGENNAIVLRLNNGSAAAEIPVYVESFEAQGLIPIVVEFYILPSRLEAKISLSETHSNAGKIQLPGALKGDGKITLGGESSALTSTTPSTPAAQTPVKTDAKPDTAIKSESTEGSLIKDSAVEETDANTVETNAPRITQQTSTIWDEFAILFSSTPLFQEEIFTAAVTETAGIFPAEIFPDEIKPEIKPENNIPEANQNKSEQKVITSLTTDNTETVTETVGGEDTIFPEIDTNNSIQERETVIIPPEND